jgi:hypothetical protein
MTTLFVNPAPDQTIERYLGFDFPCSQIGVGVEQPPSAPGTTGYCPFVNPATGLPPAYGNVNLRSPGIESLYGRLGTPRREQGHPFIKESPNEPEDPPARPVGYDLIVDIDHGIQINHTARLSGSFVDLLASKPFLSTVIATATPTDSNGHSVRLGKFVNWLEPQAEGPNVWFWRNPGASTSELLFTAHIYIPNPTRIQVDGAVNSLTAEAIYKLVFQWKFYKWVGNAPAPVDPPDPETTPNATQRMGISGFDEATSFEVIRKTMGP